MKENFIPCHGILFDLGVSSLQLDTEKRGFSFKRHDPLDMRFSFEQKLSAKDIINTFSEKELADIIFDFGEDRKARKIAEIIVNNRPLEFADELAELDIAPVVTVVSENYPDSGHTPAGRKIIVCPAQTKDNVTCKTCKLCSVQNRPIIGFRAHGTNKKLAELTAVK